MEHVSNGVSPGFCSRTCFLTCVNDLESGMTSGIAKFAYDTKMYTVIKIKDCKHLQGISAYWASKWQMSFNTASVQ